jgi:hypothetical protein
VQRPQQVYRQAVQNQAHEEREAQPSTALNRSESNATALENPESRDALVSANERKSLQTSHLETKGIEPSFRRCDRRVLPLHHVPKTLSRYFTAWCLKVKNLLKAFRKIT